MCWEALAHSTNIAFVSVVDVSLHVCLVDPVIIFCLGLMVPTTPFRGGSFQNGFVVLVPGVGDHKYSPYLAPGTLVLDSMCGS